MSLGVPSIWFRPTRKQTKKQKHLISFFFFFWVTGGKLQPSKPPTQKKGKGGGGMTCLEMDLLQSMNTIISLNYAFPSPHAFCVHWHSHWCKTAQSWSETDGEIRATSPHQLPAPHVRRMRAGIQETERSGAQHQCTGLSRNTVRPPNPDPDWWTNHLKKKKEKRSSDSARRTCHEQIICHTRGLGGSEGLRKRRQRWKITEYNFSLVEVWRSTSWTQDDDSAC